MHSHVRLRALLISLMFFLLKTKFSFSTRRGQLPSRNCWFSSRLLALWAANTWTLATTNRTIGVRDRIYEEKFGRIERQEWTRQTTFSLFFTRKPKTTPNRLSEVPTVYFLRPPHPTPQNREITCHVFCRTNACETQAHTAKLSLTFLLELVLVPRPII